MFKNKTNLFISILFSLCSVFADCSFLSSAENPSASIEAYTPFAIRYRFDSTKSKEENDKNRSQVLQELSETLPVYSNSESLEAVVHSFFADYKDKEQSSYSIVTIGTGGNSEDVVFLVKDQSGKTIYAIKAFAKPFELKGKFLPEFCGYEFLMELNVPGTEPIQPLSLAIGEYNGKVYGLMLETAAKGKQIDQYLSDIGKNVHGALFDSIRDPDGAGKREKAFEEAKNALQKLAEVLVEFHETKSAQSGPIPEDDLQKFRKELESLKNEKEVIAEISKKIDFEFILERLDQIEKEVRSVPVFYSFRLGANHFGNSFYDEETGLISFIDIGKMLNSFDHLGHPIGTSYHDLMRAEVDLYRKGAASLTTPEIEELKKNFYDSYENKGGKLEKVFVFYRVTEHIRALRKSGKYFKEEDPTQRAKGKIFFNYNLDLLIEEITK